MTRKQKYDYDIKKIEALQNQGMSVRAIARKFGWNEDNTQQWINWNFDKTRGKLSYTPKKKGKSHA